MAKQKKNTTDEKVVAATATHTHKKNNSFLQNKYLPYLVLFCFTFLIYANSISNKYAIDDTMVITDNKFTKKGLAGVREIMEHDAFVGYFGDRGAKLVSGGRYRPLSIATFAVEYEISRKLKGDDRKEFADANIIVGDEKVDKFLSPALSHTVNVLLFCIVVLLLYHVLKTIFAAKKDAPFYISFAFVATLLFAAHPIHTEAVTNIKGRDEVMGLLFGLSALYCALKLVKTENIGWIFLGVIAMFLGMLSKENVITFLAVIPLTFYFFTKAKGQDYAMTILMYLIPVGMYLALRAKFTASGLTQESPEILNNPFAYATGFEERYATIIYTFLLYLKVLIFPHPLSHDYYFNQIPYVKFSSPEFILSFVINGALIGYAIYGLIKRKVPAYAILFYFITFSIVSNLFFTVGVLMNERFVFFSSVGFCILLAYAIFRLLHIFKLDVIKFTPIFVGVIVLLYSIKTITRNTAWENNYKLFLTDVAYSPNSAKLQTSVGGDMTKEADALTDTIQKKLLLQEAITHLNKAIAIYPNHSNALLLLGNALYKLNKNPNEVIPIYNKAEQTRQGGYYDANYNVGCVEIENGMPQLAKENFLKAYTMSPTMHECVFNLGEAYAQTGNIDSALYFYKHSIELKPTTPNGYYKVGTIYGKQLNQLDSAIVYLNKAVEYGPNVELYYEDLAVAYGLKNNIAKAIEVSLNCLKFNPNYLPSIRILAISYKRMGDQANAQRYAKMANMTL